MTDKDIGQAIEKELGFRIEFLESCHVKIDAYGRAPASNAEISLWQSLLSARREAEEVKQQRDLYKRCLDELLKGEQP